MELHLGVALILGVASNVSAQTAENEKPVFSDHLHVNLVTIAVYDTVSGLSKPHSAVAIPAQQPEL